MAQEDPLTSQSRNYPSGPQGPSARSRYPSVSKKQISSLLSRTHVFLLRAQRLLSFPSTSGIDAFLCTLCYLLTLLSARLSSVLTTRLQRLATTIAKNASDTLLPGETLVATVEAPPSASRIARAADSSKKLADLIADVRIFVRLWALLDIYAWGHATYISPPKDRLLKAIAWASVGASAAFQYLENGAYLAQHGVLNWSERKQTRWWVWSSRCWATAVALDLAKLMRKRSLRKAEARASGEEKEEKIQRRKDEAAWLKDVVVSAAYAPMTWHWSVEEGLFSETWIGIFGTIAGGLGLKGQVVGDSVAYN